jgi:hypothetical protein
MDESRASASPQTSDVKITCGAPVAPGVTASDPCSIPPDKYCSAPLLYAGAICVAFLRIPLTVSQVLGSAFPPMHVKQVACRNRAGLRDCRSCLPKFLSTLGSPLRVSVRRRVRRAVGLKFGRDQPTRSMAVTDEHGLARPELGEATAPECFHMDEDIGRLGTTS